MSAYARPAPPMPETPMPAEKFSTAVHSAIGGSKDVPHLTEPLIDKYVTDLQQLGLLESASGAAVG